MELDCLPCYLPGLMGCRNVECYEWLNRIEEGTYGVVHRAKDKKTGRCMCVCVCACVRACGGEKMASMPGPKEVEKNANRAIHITQTVIPTMTIKLWCFGAKQISLL